MGTNDLIGWGSLLLFVVGFLALYRFIVSPGRRLERALVPGALGLQKIEPRSRRWQELEAALAELFGASGERYKLGAGYYRRPDVYLVSMVTRRTVSRAGGRSTRYGKSYRYVSARPTGLESGYSINVKPGGFGGKLVLGVLQRMEMEPADAGLLPEFSERFWAFGSEPTIAPPQVSQELQEAFLRQTRSTWADPGALKVLAGGSGVRLAPQGFSIDFGAQVRITLEDIREVLELGDAVRKALDAGA